jgi:hypothetical protein
MGGQQFLLGKGSKCKEVSGSVFEKCDGCVVHLDKNRSKIVRSVQTAARFEKRNKEHETSYKLQDETQKLDCDTSQIRIHQRLFQLIGNLI